MSEVQKIILLLAAAKENAQKANTWAKVAMVYVRRAQDSIQQVQKTLKQV